MSNAEACRDYYDKYRRRVLGYAPRQPNGPVIEHVTLCHQAGMSRAAIAKAAGVSENTVGRLLAGDKYLMLQSTARKLLAVRLSPPATPIGIARRVQALNALGWSDASIARAAGVHRETIQAWRHGVRTELRASTNGIIRAYDALCMRRPPRGTRTERAAASRAASRAERNGWAPPLAWDDETIDDPAAEPVGAGYVEPTPVEHVLQLVSQGLTHQEIADARGVTKEAVRRMLVRAQKRGAA